MSPLQLKSGVTRTRTGCWTCRARRKKCDEGRPVCQACQGLGLQCEGYGVRLKWAIRGQPCVTVRHLNLRKTRGPKVEPKVEPKGTPITWPASVLGEGERESDQVLLQYLGWDVYASLSKFERDVLYDFADYGALTLFSKPAIETVPDPERFRESLGYCAQSRLMLMNSLTYQITQDPKLASYVDEYYGRSIRAFRHALSDPVRFAEDMTPYAGILLCSISMNRAMPFSIHLNGIASIFHERHIAQPPTDDARELAMLIGVLDLPVYSLGRQTKHLNVWHDYCMGQSGLEEVTGLPCSLVDLLASPMDDDIEERLLQWPGEPNHPVMCKIWEATQYAGLILAREYRTIHGFPLNIETQSTSSTVRCVLTLIHELRMGMNTRAFGSTQAFFMPLVAAASQPKSLTADDRAFIRECLFTLADGTLSDYPYYEAASIVLERLWASDGTPSLDHITRELNFELGLF